MTDIKLTYKDFKEFSNITGAEFYTINEKLVKQILNNQETVERLKLAIDSYEGKTGAEFTAKIPKEILGVVKVE